MGNLKNMFYGYGRNHDMVIYLKSGFQIHGARTKNFDKKVLHVYTDSSELLINLREISLCRFIQARVIESEIEEGSNVLNDMLISFIKERKTIRVYSTNGAPTIGRIIKFDESDMMVLDIETGSTVLIPKEAFSSIMF